MCVGLWGCSLKLLVFLAETGTQGDTAPVKTLHSSGEEGKSQDHTGLRLCAWPAREGRVVASSPWKTSSIPMRTFLGSDRESGTLDMKLRKLHAITEESLPHLTTLPHPHKWLEFKIQLGRGRKRLSVVLHLNFIIPGRHHGWALLCLLVKWSAPAYQLEK